MSPSTIMKTVALVTWVLASSACGLPLVAGADYSPDTDFSGYRTFAWDDPDELPTGDPRLDNNPFFRERLHAAIERELTLRGIRYDAANPDLLVHHHATVEDRLRVFEVDRSRGYRPPRPGPRAQVVEWEEGTFVVDLAHAESKEILWRGWAQTDIELALVNPDRMTELVNAAIERMFDLFPVEAR